MFGNQPGQGPEHVPQHSKTPAGRQYGDRRMSGIQPESNPVFSEATIAKGNKILEASRAFDIGRLGFIGVVSAAMTSLGMGPFKDLPEDSELRSYLGNRKKSRTSSRGSNAATQSSDQYTPQSLTPASLASAANEWRRLHERSTEAIDRLPEEDDRDAYYAVRDADKTTEQLKNEQRKGL